MESFEITFFSLRDQYDKDTINIIANQFKKYDIFQKRSTVELFCYEDKDFVEFCISIFDFTLTAGNLEYVMTKISQFVSSVLESVDDIFLAVGIYELTHYLTENIRYINEFDDNFTRKFPFVFFRKGRLFDSGRTIYNDENVICVFNENAQSIYL